MPDTAQTAAARGFLLPLLSAVLFVSGLALLVGGGMLLGLGGSAYYVLAGAALVACGWFVWRRNVVGLRLYGWFLLATIAWAITESGFAGWALAPRLGYFLALGLPFLVSGLRRRIGAGRVRILPAAAGMVLAVLAGWVLHGLAGYRAEDPAFALGTAPLPPRTSAQGVGAGADWTTWGSDQNGSRFSTLDQINAGNVAQLQVAWTYRTGPALDGAVGFLEVTPLKVGDTLYLCTATNDVIALDAETGRQRWRFNAGINRHGFFSSQCRGVAYYRARTAAPDCAERIITNTVDARLIALDATTGKPCSGFGTNGQVSLLKGMGEVIPGYYFVSSAPVVVRDRVVLGGWIADNESTGEPSGAIRAFDARTGRFAWAFDAGRPDRTGEPGPDETYTRGTPNSWAPMSADPELGLVYAPTGNATPDFFGGQRRPFDDKYSSSVVALDVETGKPRWTFQTTHHDLWDYDVASQPVLVDFPTPQGLRKALVQGTKRGQVFVLDRQTGAPLIEVKERPVPQTGAAPGERLSPTQPFAAGMPDLSGPMLSEAQMWGVTPFDQLWCRVRFREARFEGYFTPPGLTPNIIFPGYGGGMNWGSVTIDRDRNLMLAMLVRAPFYQKLITRREADQRGIKPMVTSSHYNSQLAAMAGTPYGLETGPFLSPLGVPCNQPPYGLLVAIDLKTRKPLWQRAIGDAKSMGPLGVSSHLPVEIGIPVVGGSMATRGGLTFIGAAVDGTFRALDTASGKTLWQTQLPAGGNAVPMSYLAPSGRQMVVIAAGGHYAAKRGDYIIAYALPRKP